MSSAVEEGSSGKTGGSSDIGGGSSGKGAKPVELYVAVKT
jgi:hypothetical protein